MGLTCKHQIFELAFPIYLPLFCGMGRWNMSKVLDLIAKGSHMNRRSHTDCFFLSFPFLFFLILALSLSPSFSHSRCPINNSSRQALVLYQCHSRHNWQTPIVILLMYLFQFRYLTSSVQILKLSFLFFILVNKFKKQFCFQFINMFIFFKIWSKMIFFPYIIINSFNYN